MKVTVFGIGYVGLVQAAVLAQVGHDVVCVDVDPARVESLKRGQIPIFEPGLSGLVERNVAENRLTFTTQAPEGVAHGDIQFIAVGTPLDQDGSADSKNVLAVAQSIGTHMNEDKVVVIKSTVPVGTGDRVEHAISAALKARDLTSIGFHVISNPEFLKEGSAVSDCMKPDRIVIGTSNRDAELALRELYAPFNRSHEKIIVMDRRSAEMTKYAANCMLATKISFMNEMATLAEALGADIEHVRLGIGSDPRIGYHFIYPGIGYGGSCFPKDIQALIRVADTVGIEPHVLKAVEMRNTQQKRIMFDKINSHFGGNLKGKVFALWGLAFKPNTDDMREASSRVLMEALWDAGASVRAFDPEAMVECARVYGQREDLVLCQTKDEVLEGAHALIVATEWKLFQAPDFSAIERALVDKVIFDGRNIYDPEIVSRYRLKHYGIGRSQVGPIGSEPGKLEGDNVISLSGRGE